MTESTTPKIETAKPPRSGFGMLAAALIAGAVGGAGTYYVLQPNAQSDSLRPPIAILDITSAAHDIPKEGDVSILVNERIEKLRRAAEKLRKAGWIVLDSQAVVGAPEALYVPYDANP